MKVKKTYSLPISKKGQVTVPIDIRRNLNLQKGGMLLLSDVGSREYVIIRPIFKSFKESYGAVEPLNKSIKEQRRIAKDERVMNIVGKL
jgi:AbrB family looped-hinge helix DNA binding protein